jgi:tetratricopeptide (TPR) repeat protein
MASANESEKPIQPPLGELMTRYLARQADAHASGLGAPMDLGGEVVPFEAAPVQTVDPRLAWDEALAAVRHFQPSTKTRSWQAPPDWPMLVASHEPTVALAFCVGNFPQLVRHLRPMLENAKLDELRPSAGRSVPTPALISWANENQSFPKVFLALGALRLARQFEQADALVSKHRSEVPEEWRAAWLNEEAALAWHRGRAEEALTLWQAQPASVPVLFNRGMAALFLGKHAEARKALAEAIAKLPEASAWHHLGRLYLTLAEMRS